MTALFYYLLFSTGYMLVFWLLYLVFFRNKSGHAGSRVWLLLTVTLPMFLPLVRLPMPGAFALRTPAFALPEVTINSNPVTGGIVPFFSASGSLPALYCLVAAVLLLRIAVSYYSVYQIIRAGHRQQVMGKTVYTQTGIGPGSIGHTIFFPTGEIVPQMLQHELAHVRLCHGADLLLVQLISAVVWPNVLIRIILKELRTVHEFQADAGAGSEDSRGYSLLLLDTTLNTRHFSSIHTFYQPPLKRRIIMLQQTNKRLKKGSIFSAIILAATFSTTALWAQQDSTEKPPAIEKPKPELMTAPNAPESIMRTNDGKAFNYVDQMPKFNGDLSTWLGKHIKYPEKARKAGVQGRSIIKFIVAENGSVMAPEVVHSSGSAELDNAALAVIKKMPAWKPGMQDGKAVSVYFTLPVSWRLGK